MLTELPPAFLLTASFALGACVGSFLNVVVYRLPHGESIIHPRSRCPACQDTIPAWANVPILSWLYLRGRCRSCKSPISIRYPLVEIATATLFALLMLRWLEVGPGPRLLVDWLLASSLVGSSPTRLPTPGFPSELLWPGSLPVPAWSTHCSAW